MYTARFGPISLTLNSASDGGSVLGPCTYFLFCVNEHLSFVLARVCWRGLSAWATCFLLLFKSSIHSGKNKINKFQLLFSFALM